MTLIQFASAFGLGALVTAFVQAWLANRAYISKRNFEEKKESYIGFLDALHNSETIGTHDAARMVGHWHNRIKLVGSESVIACCAEIQSTNPMDNEVHPDRPQALSALMNAMRRDLKVAM